MKYAIFDMDGLLIDSEPLWQKAEQEILLEQYGLELELAEVARYCGTSTREFANTMARIHPEALIKPDELREAIFDTMGARIHQAPLMPGAEELLQWLLQQSIGLAIASSSPLLFIESVVKKYDLPVQVFASGIEVPRSKPHPAVFELAAHRLDAFPWQCRIWEDSVNGLIAGKAAGMEVVAVPGLAHPRPEQFSIADHIHRNLYESLDSLQQVAAESIE
ncbi:HAD family phosphatase [Motiliproteus sp. MSK22-1]|uniref:HAD family hydrolase n=1 Tax=Motiliproteus sp. MSK22-1 TaxID=1897630 RepID=UPI000975F9B7|nr:HAD family phosphatase [Motiliproteus sp. MSK22-1]OMH38851.1 haloacid dehalogenase [Motiliproteus sp. MSK22-1]